MQKPHGKKKVKPNKTSDKINEIADEIAAREVDQKLPITRGKYLSDQELTEIKNLSLQGVSDVRISELLKRDVRTIVAARKKIGIKKTGKGKIITEVQKHAEVKLAKSHEGKLLYWQKQLISSPRYNVLQESLTKDDLAVFIEMWCKFHVDIEDMNTVEEDNLEVLIILKLRINENNKAVKLVKEREVLLQEKLKELGELDLDTDSHRWLHEQVMSNNNNLQALNKDIKDLILQYEKTTRLLNISREQREAKKNVGVDTFQKLVAQFTEIERREEAGKYAERMRLATEKKDQELKSPYEFADKNISPIILDGADLFRQRQEQELEKAKEKDDE